MAGSSVVSSTRSAFLKFPDSRGGEAASASPRSCSTGRTGVTRSWLVPGAGSISRRGKRSPPAMNARARSPRSTTNEIVDARRPSTLSAFPPPTRGDLELRGAALGQPDRVVVRVREPQLAAVLEHEAHPNGRVVLSDQSAPPRGRGRRGRRHLERASCLGPWVDRATARGRARGKGRDREERNPSAARIHRARHGLSDAPARESNRKARSSYGLSCPVGSASAWPTGASTDRFRGAAARGDDSARSRPASFALRARVRGRCRSRSVQGDRNTARRCTGRPVRRSRCRLAAPNRRTTEPCPRWGSNSGGSADARISDPAARTKQRPSNA